MQEDKHSDQVIVIGASLGGLTALRELLRQLPSDLEAAVLITMHIGNQPSRLPGLLAEATSMEIDFAVAEENISGRHHLNFAYFFF